MSAIQGVGYEKLMSITTPKELTSIPASVRSAWLQAETEDVRLRLDGVSPTSSTGMLLKAGLAPLEVHGRETLQNLRVLQNASGAVLHVLYFGQ
jgi:hypothetical protein